MSRSQRLTLVATILGSTVVFLDSTVVNVALPSIGDDLDAGLAGQQWVVEAYMLTMVSLLLVGGSLGDQFGRRRLFVIGLVAFGATSPLGACVPSSRAGEGNARFWTAPPSGRMSQRSHGQRVLPRADQVLHELPLRSSARTV